jgi:hypothetical protein
MRAYTIQNIDLHQKVYKFIGNIYFIIETNWIREDYVATVRYTRGGN